jgi:hypothetical protein
MIRRFFAMLFRTVRFSLGPLVASAAMHTVAASDQKIFPATVSVHLGTRVSSH